MDTGTCPRRRKPRSGGDFYDALETPWGLRLVVGDVRGKGLYAAVRLASALLGEFRSRASSEPELTAVVKTVDAAGACANDNAGEDFVTALFVQLDGDILTIIRYGHPLPILGQGQAVHPLGTHPSRPLCLGTEASSDELRLAPGSRILLQRWCLRGTRREGRVLRPPVELCPPCRNAASRRGARCNPRRPGPPFPRWDQRRCRPLDRRAVDSPPVWPNRLS